MCLFQIRLIYQVCGLLQVNCENILLLQASEIYKEHNIKVICSVMI